VKPSDVLDAAVDAFQLCKTTVEKLTHDHTQHISKLKLEELKVLAKVAIANSIQLTLAKKQPQDDSKKVTTVFNISAAYPVMTLN